MSGIIKNANEMTVEEIGRESEIISGCLIKIEKSLNKKVLLKNEKRVLLKKEKILIKRMRDLQNWCSHPMKNRSVNIGSFCGTCGKWVRVVDWQA